MKVDQYDVVNWILSGLYGLLLFLGIALYFGFIQKRFHSNLFFITYTLGLSWRCVAFALQPFIREKMLIIGSAVNFIITSLPAFFLFSTYMVVLLLWAETYFNSYDQNYSFYRPVSEQANQTLGSLGPNVRYFRNGILAINIIMYITVITCCILDLYAKGLVGGKWMAVAGTKFEVALLISVSVMYIITTLVFFISGYLVYRYHFYRVGVARSLAQKRTLRKVGFLGIICVLCFLIRATLVILQFKFTIVNSSPIILGSYYVGLEMIPLILMLLVVKAVCEPKGKSQQDLSTYKPLIT